MPPRKTPETTQMNLLLCDSKPMMLPDDKQRELAIAQGHTAADRIKQNSGYSSVPWAPWEIPIQAIESAEVVQEVARAKCRPRNLTVTNGPSMPMFAEIGEDTGGLK